MFKLFARQMFYRSAASALRRLGIITSIFAVIGAAGCDKGSSIGASQGTAPSKQGAERTVTSNALAQKGGLCDENRKVSSPDPDSPEWMIWRAYQLALAEDNESNMNSFVQLFPPSKNAREIKEMYWNRLRSSVHKFTQNGKPDYVICRSIATDQGRKYFINTSDPRQTPPPTIVGEIDGKQRIILLTPF